MANYTELFKNAAAKTNEDVVSEGGFNPLPEGVYNLKIIDVRFDPFHDGQSFAFDYETEDGQRASETFSIETRDANGAEVKQSRLENNVNRLVALMISVQMAGILSADDFEKGDAHVVEMLLPMVDLTFWSKVTVYEYVNKKNEQRSRNQFTYEKEKPEEN